MPAFKSSAAGNPVAAAKPVIDVGNSVYETIAKATKQPTSQTDANIVVAIGKKKAA